MADYGLGDALDLEHVELGSNPKDVERRLGKLRVAKHRIIQRDSSISGDRIKMFRAEAALHAAMEETEKAFGRNWRVIVNLVADTL
jgi:hypothetical protein